MSYVNVGARVSGARPKTKGALRRALTESPELVQFDVTSRLGPRGRSGAIDATAEDIGSDKLSVVGPDPYTARNWYATVEVTKGKVRVY